MKKLLKTLACSAVVALLGSSALADYGWYDGSMSIGGVSTDFMSWSTDGDHPTDLGDLTDMTITSVDLKVWSDANDRGGANMFFRIWDGGASQVGSDQDLWLGASTRITGDHNFSISWSGTEDLAAAVGLTLEHEHAYYIDMWAKTYGTSGDEWYSANSANFHAKLTYRKPQTVTFNANGGQCDPLSKVYAIGVPYGELPTPTLAGSALIGWFDEDTGERVKAKYDVPDQATRTLVAEWGLPQTVTFDMGEGTGQATCSIYTMISAIGGKYEDMPKPTWAGHTFAGWYDAQGNRVKDYYLVTDESSRTLIASWKGLKQTVHFDAGDGVCSPDSVQCFQGETYIGFPTPTWAGHTFVGWYDDATGTRYKNYTRPVTDDSDLYLTAHWKGARQTVYFDPGEGECSKSSVMCFIGETYIGFPTPVRDNCAFRGWFDENGKRYKNYMKPVSDDPELHLFAKWQENTAPLAIAGFSFASKAAKGKRDASSILSEDFANFTAAASSTDVSGKLNDYTAVAGWTGSKVYADAGRIKLGTGSANGWIATPAIDLPAGATISCKVVKYGSDTGTVSIALSTDNGSNWSTLGDAITPTSDGATYERTVSSAVTGAKIRFISSVKRFNLDDVVITAGSASKPTVTLALDPDVDKIAVGDVLIISAEADGFTDNDAVTWSWTGDYVKDGEDFLLDTTEAGEKTVTAKAKLGDQEDEDSVTIKVCTPHAINVTVGGHGIAMADAETAIEGTTVTVEWVPDDGYTLDAITVNNGAVTVADGKFEMPDAVANVSVTFVEQALFKKITSVDELSEGEYVIVGAGPATGAEAGKQFAMKATLSGSVLDRRDDAVTIENNVITDADDSIIWTLGKVDDGWTISSIYGDFGYVSFVAEKKVEAVAATNVTDKGTWTVTASNGLFRVANVDSSAYSLQYNAGSPRFTCYGNSQKDVSLYKKAQKVTFDPDGGECEPLTAVYATGIPYGELPTPTLDGQALIGWFDEDTVERVKAKHIVPDQPTRTLVALWGDPQAVTLDMGDGTGVATCDFYSFTAAIGGKYEEMPKPTWEGHTFVGWYDAAGNRVKDYYLVTDESSRTLFAHWKGLRQTIHFDAGDGEVEKDSVQCFKGETYIGFPTPVWAGHTFVGWYDDATGTRYKNYMSPVTDAADLYLTAHWKGARQTVYFDPGEGDCSKLSVMCYIGETYIGFPTPVRDNCAFRGWYDETGKRYKNYMRPVTDDSELWLYAKWQENAAPLAISGFTMGRSAAPAARSARADNADTIECTLWYETVGGVFYELQWTPLLDGEWTTLKYWMAEEDELAGITVEIPSSNTGFFRLLIVDGDFDEEFDED